MKKACDPNNEIDLGTRKIPQYVLVQFHPTYDYSNFVEGLQPENENEKMSFVKMDGVFKRFCRNVAEYNAHFDNPKEFYFVIDEINRADLGRVFGELMYCIDEGYRGVGNECHTQYENLKETYGIQDDIFSNGFFVPKNIHIIGTMNDIDRSVESIDFAMRRRFKWVEVTVNDDMLKKLLPPITNFEEAELGGLIARINKLNNSIKESGSRFNLDSSYCVGPGYFKRFSGKNYEELWNDYVEQILIEYVRGRRDSQSFIDECKNGFVG